MFLFGKFAALCVIGFCYCLSLIQGSEVVYIQHAPSYMKFSTEIQQPFLKASQLPDVLAAACGFTTDKDLQWGGLQSGNPLKRPKAVIVTEFDGFQHINLGLSKVQYPFTVDVQPGWPFRVLADGIYKRFSYPNLTLIEITNDDLLYSVKLQYPKLLQFVSDNDFNLAKDLLSEKSVLNGKQLKVLNMSSTADAEFLMDMQLFDEVATSLRMNKKELLKGSAVDLIWLHSTMMENLKDKYGADSAQVNEAVQVIRDELIKLDNSFSKIYGDNYLMIVLTVDYMSKGDSIRIARSLSTVATSNISATINVSVDYDEDYPAIFNIIFFTCLIIFLSLFAIALGMWHIDPGRDSIIYRMTSQRIKKDQ